MIHETPNCYCPTCGKSLPFASGMNGDAEPQPGGYSICIGCGTVLEFNADMSVMAITDIEIDPEVRDIVLRWAYIVRARGSQN